MNEQGGHEEHETPGRTPLEYRAARDDVPASTVGELVVSLIATAVTWCAAVPAFLSLAFAMDYKGPDAPAGSLGVTIAFAAWAVILGAIVVLSVHWRTPPRRHRVLGMWIGTGVAGLIVGTCFVAM